MLRRPEDRLLELSRRLDELQSRGDRAIDQNLHRAGQQMKRFAAQLESLSPLGVLGRGYSITQIADGTGDLASVVTDSSLVNVGDQLVTRLAAGKINSRVESVEP